MAEERLSIYRASRSIKKKQNSLYNALRSIYEDSIFVSEIAELWRELPLVANLRCGLWYSSRFDGTCYFKSTDGHCKNWSFSISRLNFHVAHLCAQKGGCIIVDSTRKGKRFPDSMSKTIPIWSCVLNRAIMNYLEKCSTVSGTKQQESNVCPGTKHTSPEWDCSLYLPLWVSAMEKAAIEDRLEDWTKQLEASGVDISSLAQSLKKPLRPLWVSQKTVVWLNEVPDFDSWDFTPVILVSASSSNGIVQHRFTSEFSWHYISGAGDDEESWARGLTPQLFWKNVIDLIDSDPDLCNQQVADIVEKDRVYRCQRGEDAPQVIVKPKNLSVENHNNYNEECNACPPLGGSEYPNNHIDMGSLGHQRSMFWIGSTNLAVGSTQLVTNLTEEVACTLNCEPELSSICFPCSDTYLHLPMVSSKQDRFSLLRNLPAALSFAQSNLRHKKKLLICCDSGKDISVCVALAIITSLFDGEGSFDDGKSFTDTHITKLEMRRKLSGLLHNFRGAGDRHGILKQQMASLLTD
ncbi:tRNA A64-2'-O-ribosylphosphate transferase isoform X2 [Aristolochia californica]|uniref:tRNA A64-2'-O-ribosylphosphate transferase isoform X2 n=1 Tax=Aristolochia californica TaxID=171875 RepID=UPI0035E000AF